jgi:hypothetical protein
VKDGKYDLPKNIDIIYFDGTFKAKLDSGLHYNILFFATVSKEIHKFVHLGFVICFSSTHAEYMNICKGIVDIHFRILVLCLMLDHLS